ncbi:MAG: tRNA lysidine(34) synthetase TilS [Lachnospiraceae bacterium]|nr:tRNA lysidine(34) synthetase TilS [Lachnospiraceae bacterium]
MDEFFLKVERNIASESLIESSVGDAPDVIVALSGGADSVALLVVLNQLGYRCVSAHCNFHLRGEESDRDMDFAQSISGIYACDFKCVHFDVENYKKSHGVSTEMACRELRYDWFRKLSAEYGGIPVAVAHHRDDNEETFFLNLLRGTGITGLCGMRSRNGIFIRPLLNVGRNEILDFLEKQGISYVTDSTNLENDVKRNRLRNIILPAIREQFPDADTGILHTMSDLTRNRSLYAEAVAAMGERYIDPQQRIDVALMAKEVRNSAMLLYELIRDRGFSYLQAVDVMRFPQTSGRRFYSRGCQALLDRGMLLISAGGEMPSDVVTFNIGRDGHGVPEGLKAKFISRGELRPDRSGKTLYLDASLLDDDPVFTLRGWCAGDRIQPFGMKGSRLVSDIMSDAKLSLNDKQRVRLLEVNGKVVWVVGLRASRHYPVTEDVGSVLCLTCG